MFGTPIINPPQSAILGMHGIFDRPIAVNKQVTSFLCFICLLVERSVLWQCLGCNLEDQHY